MPSKAYKSFKENAEDIDRLMSVYDGVHTTWEESESSIPEGYEVLFRSAIVLMVSHWEAYLEDICSEALEHMVLYAENASKLPMEVKKQVAIEVKAAKNEIEPWVLADGGWRTYLKQRLPALKEARDRSFNTPKAQNTGDFFRRALGIEDIRTNWNIAGHTPDAVARKLDALVEVRGQIAHRGRLTRRLDGKYVTEHVEFLRSIVSKTGGTINAHVKRVTGKALW